MHISSNDARQLMRAHILVVVDFNLETFKSCMNGGLRDHLCYLKVDFGCHTTVDVVEIGERMPKVGEVLKVKPLAVLAMIDEGELDWKVIAISIDDPKAHLVNDVSDVDQHFPVSSKHTYHDHRILKFSFTAH